MPALSHALRVTFDACSPAWVTHPPTICSISAGSTPERFTTSIWAAASSSAACRPDNHPLRLPIGVRTASTITGWAIRVSSSGRARPGGGPGTEPPA